MFYEFQLKDYISISPDMFDKDLKEAIFQKLDSEFTERTDEDIGLVISIKSVDKIGTGSKLPESPDRYFPITFTVLTYKPELHDVFNGVVTSITNFGAFINLGVIEGLAHLTQTMNDFVSFSKSGVIQGRETGQTLKAGDLVRAKIVAVSFKDLSNVKVGLTMRQPGLGKLETLEGEN